VASGDSSATSAAGGNFGIQARGLQSRPVTFFGDTSARVVALHAVTRTSRGSGFTSKHHGHMTDIGMADPRRVKGGSEQFTSRVLLFTTHQIVVDCGLAPVVASALGDERGHQVGQRFAHAHITGREQWSETGLGAVAVYPTSARPEHVIASFVSRTLGTPMARHRGFFLVWSFLKLSFAFVFLFGVSKLVKRVRDS